MSLSRLGLIRTGLVMASTTLLGVSAWLVFRPRPNFDRAVALAEAGRLDEAERFLSQYLRENPRSDSGHLLMAQIQVSLAERHLSDSRWPDSRLALAALNHLRMIHPDDRNQAALVSLSRGKAEYYLSRFDQAEELWNEALRLNPKVPEAGWSLLDLYYLTGRSEEARRLALRLFEVEPDPRDRVQVLLELVRQDAQPPAPPSIVQWFEPRVRENPRDLHANLALGQALVRDGKEDRGLEILESAIRNHPDVADAWEGWFIGLDDAGQVEPRAVTLMAQAIERLPPTLASSPRFDRFRGRVAQERGDANEAVRAYRRAEVVAPHDHQLAYRLIRALRQVGEIHEAERREHEYHSRLTAGQEVRNLYMRANAVKTLGTQPQPGLFQEIADLRERMGLFEEARAWHRLVLRDDPQNARSQLALQRLRDGG